MNRTRLLFFAIVLVAVAGAIFLVLSSTQPQRTGDMAEAPARSGPSLPRDAVTIRVASSSTKQPWMERMAARFMDGGAKTANGRAIRVVVAPVSSGGSSQAILDGKLKPNVWSPGAAAWPASFDAQWRRRAAASAWTAPCEPTIYTPLGIAMWRPMAEALGWPDKPIGWQTLIDLAKDPNGWAAYGRPDWGKFRLGHAHPQYSNAGLLTLTSLIYGVLGKTDGLTAFEVYRPEVEQALTALGQNTAKYGKLAEDLLKTMAQQGRGYLHAVATFESDALRMNLEHAQQLRFPLVFIFPSEGVFWGSHPYCVLDRTDWTSQAQADAARRFHAFITAEAQQTAAIGDLLRPLDAGIPLRAPLDIANGTDPGMNPDKVPPLASPDAEITEAVVDLFLTTKRKATVLLVLDTSGSMAGQRMRTATEATAGFLRRLHPDDRVGVLTFSQQVVTLAAPRPVGEIGESLAGRIESLVAQGSTALHAAVCESVGMLERQRNRDMAAQENRLYGVVLLSDGDDTVANPSANKMFATCLPANAEADGVKVFSIAFGGDANNDLLERIAQATGGQLFSADPDSVDATYLAISAEQ